MAIIDPTTPGEVWYQIPSLPHHQISSDWRIRSFSVKGGKKNKTSSKWRIIKTHFLKAGYEAFHWKLNGKHRYVYLHQVIAELMYGERPDNLETRHMDDNKRNNYPSNIRYGTVRENFADRKRNGRGARGEKMGSAKLTEAQVIEIRKDIACGLMSLRAIGRKYGVHCPAIMDIRDRRTWAHVA
jgi:hypothetical protein